MEQRAAVEAFDLGGFFALLAAKLEQAVAGGAAVGAAELRGRIEARVGPIVAQNEDRGKDEPSRRNLFFTSLVLASYRELSDRLGGGPPAVDLLRDTMTELFRPRIREYIRQRFDVNPDRPSEAFERVAANFLERGQSGFGAGFTYEQEVQTERQSFVNVTSCLFLDFFRANAAPELTPVLCAMDAVWADEFNRGPYNVSFDRPTLMSRGDDKCRFQFTRSDEDDDRPREAVDRHLVRYAGEFMPVLVERASGCQLHVEGGRTILDFTSGQMCATLGHNHPAILAAVRESCSQVMHLSSWMLSQPVIDLCRELAALLPSSLERVLLLSTGSESNEAALRMAKLSTGRFEVVGLTASFHGLTGGAGASTYSVGHRGYGPAMPGTMAIPAPYCYRCPLRQSPDRCDLACLDAGFELVDAQSVGSLAACIVEPIISAGGVIVPPPGYFPRLEDHCRARGMLLILDEAQTGLGRLGSHFAFEQDGAVPDILTLSKTLGGGLPLAATVTSDRIEETCCANGFVHVTSHQSDPLPARVGLAMLEVLVREQLAERALRLGQRLRAGLEELEDRHEVIGDVRGRGLLLGVELVEDRERREPAPQLGAAVSRRALELGLNMNIVNFPGLSSVWRIAPPLTVTAEEIDRALAILDQAIRDCLSTPGAVGL
jgi:2,2-dialkylglycine decarboxylase (pyruvate)